MKIVSFSFTLFLFFYHKLNYLNWNNLKYLFFLAYDISNGYESEEIDNENYNLEAHNNNGDEAELNEDNINTNFNEEDVDVFNEDYNESSNLDDSLK